MSRKGGEFRRVECWPGVLGSDWGRWQWQMSQSLKTLDDFADHMDLTGSEREGFLGADRLFRVQTTPYYFSLADLSNPLDPIRQMILPRAEELKNGGQQLFDPLGENKPSNRATSRLIHRYTDRALFLTTDICGIYCRYCTRKHFTASDQVMATRQQLDEAVAYVRAHPEIKEILFSGGDPLTLGNKKLGEMIEAFYQIEHVELIRIGSRMATVNPFRIDQELIDLFKQYKPVYFMAHFNHPNEITEESAQALELLVDNGVPVFNQMVLLNGINNHPALVYALSRRLLRLRVKPYYMFQADPSIGTDHLRNPIENSLEIQRKLWGHTSGLAMPTYIVDIPDGGGKAALTPDFLESQNGQLWQFKGWDGVNATYASPQQTLAPFVDEQYQRDWLA